MISEFSPSAIINGSLNILVKNFVPFVIIACICLGPTIAFTIIATVSPETVLAMGGSTVNLIERLLTLVEGPLLTGALSYAVMQYLRKRPVEVGSAMSVGFRRLLPLLGVAICSGLFILVGFILLIIPGFIFYCMVYVAAAACVVEGTGVFESMKRSRTLTEGFRWRIFCIIVFMVILGFLVGAIAGFTLAMIGSPIVTVLGLLVIQIISTMWGSVAASLSYYHLRSLKESVEVDEVAQIFD